MPLRHHAPSHLWHGAGGSLLATTKLPRHFQATSPARWLRRVDSILSRVHAIRFSLLNLTKVLLGLPHRPEAPQGVSPSLPAWPAGRVDATGVWSRKHVCLLRMIPFQDLYSNTGKR